MQTSDYSKCLLFLAYNAPISTLFSDIGFNRVVQIIKILSLSSLGPLVSPVPCVVSWVGLGCFLGFIFFFSMRSDGYNFNLRAF